MVERVSKLTRLALLKGPTSEATSEAIITQLEPLKEFVLTLTSDNGKEFAGHQKISQAIDSSFFFCTPNSCLEKVAFMGARFKRKYQRIGQAIIGFAALRVPKFRFCWHYRRRCAKSGGLAQ